LGLRGPVHRTTLADANEQRDWRIYADLAQGLLRQARALYAHDSLRVELDEVVYALDASIIDLGLHLCPWARFDRERAAVKLYTLLNLRGALPAAVQITPATTQEVTWLDTLDFEPGAFYRLDRGYVDYGRLHAIEQARAWYVTRAKRRMRYCRLHSQPVDPTTGLRSDQIISLTGFYAAQDYPDKLRRVRIYDGQHQRSLVFLTNHFGLPALASRARAGKRKSVGSHEPENGDSRVKAIGWNPKPTRAVVAEAIGLGSRAESGQPGSPLPSLPTSRKKLLRQSRRRRPVMPTHQRCFDLP
jgi:hypothetical protein